LTGCHTGAFPGMNAAVTVWEAARTRVSNARWNGRAGAAEAAANALKMIDEGNNIKYVPFDVGTVWPEGVTGGMGAHANLEGRLLHRGSAGIDRSRS